MGGLYSKQRPSTCDDICFTGDDIFSATNKALVENILSHLEVKNLLALSMTSKKIIEHLRVLLCITQFQIPEGTN